MKRFNCWAWEILILAIVIGWTGGCKNNPTPAMPTPTSAATPTVLAPQPATATYVPPTLTAVQPTATLVSPTPTAGLSSQEVSVFFIALDDNGKSGKQIGCGDSLIPVETTVSAADDASAIQATLELLLATEWANHPASGLYNALSQSALRVESVSVEGGTATAHLVGTVMMGGVCDTPRFKAQLEELVLQFASVQEVFIFINGEALNEVLSQQ